MRSLLTTLLIVSAVLAVTAHRKGGKNHDKPNFLKGLDQSKITEYHQIAHNANLTKRQHRAAIEQYVANLPAENKKLYSDWKSKQDAKQQEIEATFTEKIASLSKEGQDLAKKIKAVHENLDLTKTEEREQVQALRQAAPAEARKEVKKIFPGHHKKGQRKIQKTPN